MSSPMPSIPLRIRVCDDGSYIPKSCFIEIWVATAYTTKMAATLSVFAGRAPSVYRHVEYGSAELPCSLRDRFVLCCFQRVIRAQLSQNRYASQVDVPNAARWIARQFAAEDAKVIIRGFSNAIDQRGTFDFSFGVPPSEEK